MYSDFTKNLNKLNRTLKLEELAIEEISLKEEAYHKLFNSRFPYNLENDKTNEKSFDIEYSDGKKVKIKIYEKNKKSCTKKLTLFKKLKKYLTNKFY